MTHSVYMSVKIINVKSEYIMQLLYTFVFILMFIPLVCCQPLSLYHIVEVVWSLGITVGCNDRHNIL